MKMLELLSFTTTVSKSPDIAFLFSLMAIATGAVLVATYGGVAVPNIVLIVLGAFWVLQGITGLIAIWAAMSK